MKELINTSYLRLSLDIEQETVYFVWTEKSKTMTNQEFQEHLIEFTKKIVEYKIKKALIDSRLGHFVIGEEMQTWHDEEIVPIYLKNGFLKMAFVMPEDIFEALSLEQTFMEERAKKMDVQHFTDYENALAWIKEKTYK